MISKFSGITHRLYFVAIAQKIHKFILLLITEATSNLSVFLTCQVFTTLYFFSNVSKTPDNCDAEIFFITIFILASSTNNCGVTVML